MLNLFEATLRLKGFPIQEAKKRLQEIQQISETDYEAYVKDSRQKVFEYHQRENSFYQSFIDGKAIKKWEDIPVLTKRDLQIPLKKRLSNGFSKKNTYTSKTSGSSGNPFSFAKDIFCHALTWAEILDRYSWYDLNFSSSFQARFYGIPLDFKGYYTERLKDKLSNRYRFPIFNLSEEKLEQFLNIFRRKRFDYLYGYTSAIVLFAKYLKSKNIYLKEICSSLKYCIVTSEMLYENDKTLLEQQFGVPLINEYGASELDLIAFTNTKDRFKLNTETLFVEILDHKNNSIPNGEIGRIVITSLYNKAHPFIRYDIGDLGSIEASATNKVAVLEKLVGRSNDMAKLSNGKIIPGLTFYYVTKSIVEEDGNVKEFVVEQTALDAFTIVYVSEIALSTKDLKKIEIALSKYVGTDLNIHYERVEVLDRNKRGKLKQFISKIEVRNEP
tara:strand:+ start:2049 stop:3377 length:1329 start_codon:yes stop_codon:yes gene_type:complete